jgi:hypothetical protein
MAAWPQIVTSVVSVMNRAWPSDLLAHRSGRITTHYSQAELMSLIEAAERVCETESRKTPATTWLRRKTG